MRTKRKIDGKLVGKEMDLDYRILVARPHPRSPYIIKELTPKRGLEKGLRRCCEGAEQLLNELAAFFFHLLVGFIE